MAESTGSGWVRRTGQCSPGSAPPRGHNDLDVIAAGIWLSISELCTGCLQLPSGVE